jgi:hypothetical protein
MHAIRQSKAQSRLMKDSGGYNVPSGSHKLFNVKRNSLTANKADLHKAEKYLAVGPAVGCG